MLEPEMKETCSRLTTALKICLKFEKIKQNLFSCFGTAQCIYNKLINGLKERGVDIN